MPKSMGDVIVALARPDIDDSARWVLRWQFGMITGGFSSALVEAIIRADSDNLDRLELGFPVEVRGYRQWAYGDLGDRLRRIGIDL